jgi:hypothetical protein
MDATRQALCACAQIDFGRFPNNYRDQRMAFDEFEDFELRNLFLGADK